MSDVKDKIRKLLNLANDAGAFDGEIDNALRFARRLMLQHNISENELNATKDPHEIAAETEYKRAQAYSEGVSLATWESQLAHAVARLIGSIGWYKSGAQDKRTEAGTIAFNPRTGKPTTATPVIFYGPACDVADAAEMFCEWQHVIHSMARLKFGGALRGDGAAYAQGFASALLSKVDAMAAQERQQIAQGTTTSTGGALVVRQGLALVAAKKAAAGEWLKREKGINLTTRARSGGADTRSGAYGAGRADGSRAEFSRARALRIGAW